MTVTKACVYVELEGRVHLIPLAPNLDFDLLSNMLHFFKKEEEFTLTAIRLPENVKFETLGEVYGLNQR